MGLHGKKVGLALGSGAARGLAHIGVLKVLEREGIALTAIAGTSIGALIGALYASGVSVERMEEVALNVDWKRLARLIDPIFPTSGLIDGKKVAHFIAEILPVRTFEDLHIPLSVVAIDVETGEPLVIRRGDLMAALRAAIAFPGIFTPARFGSRFLVDGGLCNPVPADVVRAMGTEVVVGVCAIPEVQKRATETFLPSPGTEESRSTERLSSGWVEQLMGDLLGSRNGEGENGDNGRRPPGLLRVCAQSIAIMENEISALRLERDHIDLLIRPELGGISLLEFHRAGEAIRAGEVATEALLERLRVLAA